MKHQAEFDQFVRALQARLERGEAEYGDASFSRDDDALAGEVREELLDVCGWSFVRWTKLRPARHSLKDTRRIRFKGNEYLLIGETDGPIATEEQYENFSLPFAHLYKDGRILRLGQQIGSRSDIEFIGGPHD